MLKSGAMYIAHSRCVQSGMRIHNIHAGFGLALSLVITGCVDNKILLPDPAVLYIAFGDSSTAGDSDTGYPQFLPDLLGRPADTVVNQGKSGETTAEGLERLDQILSLDIYPNAHTMMYWAGGIDILDFIREVDGLLLWSPSASNYPFSDRLSKRLDEIQANIETSISRGQSAGLNVYVATYFLSREVIAPCEPLLLSVILPAQARNANGYVSLLNERIRQAAANRGATLVEITAANSTLQSDSRNFANCNHLSEQGNRIVAEVFAQTLNP